MGGRRASVPVTHPLSLSPPLLLVIIITLSTTSMLRNDLKLAHFLILSSSFILPPAASGPALTAAIFVLEPGQAALCALGEGALHATEVAAREEAVLAALRLINAALRLDLRFVGQLARTRLRDR